MIAELKPGFLRFPGMFFHDLIGNNFMTVCDLIVALKLCEWVQISISWGHFYMCRWVLCGGSADGERISVAWFSGSVWRASRALWRCMELLDSDDGFGYFEDLQVCSSVPLNHHFSEPVCITLLKYAGRSLNSMTLRPWEFFLCHLYFC